MLQWQFVTWIMNQILFMCSSLYHQFIAYIISVSTKYIKNYKKYSMLKVPAWKTMMELFFFFSTEDYRNNLKIRTFSICKWNWINIFMGCVDYIRLYFNKKQVITSIHELEHCFRILFNEFVQDCRNF